MEQIEPELEPNLNHFGSATLDFFTCHWSNMADLANSDRWTVRGGWAEGERNNVPVLVWQLVCVGRGSKGP